MKRNPSLTSSSRVMMALAFAASIASSGCLFSSNNSQPVSQPAPDTSPVWMLSYQVKSDTAPEQSVAYYGFSVKADGSYQVGPGPQGQVQNGKIDADELQALLVAITPELNNPALSASSAEACDDLDQDQGEITITLTQHHKTAVLVHASGTQFCHRTTSSDQANNVQNAIDTLAQKYYATPFPDVCIEAADAVTALYPSVQGCSTDADCFYVDKDFNVIPPSSLQYVYTDNCSRVTPLIVANATALLAHQSALTSALSNAQDVCGYRMVREDCTGITGFNSTQAPPLCNRGVCEVNPAITQ